LGRALSKKLKDIERLREHQQQCLEYEKAAQFCFRHSKLDPELGERIFLGDQEQTIAFVEIVLREACIAEVPDTPRGLVLADNRCRGAFQ